jgi:hypothetical protein
LEKFAAKVPFIHGTNARHPILRGGVGPTVLPGDPNPRGLYTAGDLRRTQGIVGRFATEAVKRRGGTPTLAAGKMDTKKGWAPFNVRPGSPIDVSEARELARQLDTTPDKAARGELWKLLNQHVGSWFNPDLAQTLRVKEWRDVPLAPALAARKAGTSAD